HTRRSSDLHSTSFSTPLLKDSMTVAGVDRRLLLASRGLRAFGFGFSAVLIALVLERRGLSPFLIGLTLGVGLAAASLSGLARPLAAAGWGRRPVLAAAGALMTLTGLDLAFASQPPLLVLAG